MTNNTFTDKELVQYRKYHFKRGFKICLLVVVLPIVVTIIILAQWWVNQNI